jgi:hypothetical protein
MMSIAVKLCPATDDSGKPVYLLEHLSSTTKMLGPDQEQLAKDSAGYFGVYSGKRYKLDS